MTFCVCATFLFAQQATPQAPQQGQQQQVQQQRPPQWNAASTEWYTPVPPIVKPGASPGQPPSDAIVLFDGKDLSKWESQKAPAERGQRPDAAP